ncbi:hypothetical protein [Siphonobacter sp. BAB-5405]|uniref:hypothetical protein n=1 Tax=Siphonobacter sp. BAB-5405 TaxID=1864825 RepID=UPI001E41B228|nr:hypothetical protein [Siphonobacter sp. BAB-5405]
MRALLDAILKHLLSLQSQGDAYYPAGLFPSQRLKTELGYRREDSNIFFTAITVFTLQEIRTRLSPESQQCVDTITTQAAATYPLYQNKDGLATYNFYQTQPSRHFPNGRLMHRTRHFKLPDDVDDTVMIYLITPRTPEENQWLKAKLRAHANTVKGWAETGPQAFRKKKIYSTWFGENMPIDFDTSTLSNVLLWVFRQHLPLDAFDEDVLVFIDYSIRSGEYLKNPLELSAYYATTPLIMYHVGRLLAEVPVLPDCRERLIQDMKAYQCRTFMDQIMLATTLLRLGETVPALIPADWSLKTLIQKSRNHYFSIAPLLNYYPQTRWLASWKLSHINWECPAHSLALVAEYLALQSGV